MKDQVADPENRFPDGSLVLVWYPPPGADRQDRGVWAWLPGTVAGRCGADEWVGEWQVVVEVPALAVPDPETVGSGLPEDLLYPVCFRDAGELRPVTAAVWDAARAEADRG